MHLAGSDSRKSCFGPWPACHNSGNPQFSFGFAPSRSVEKRISCCTRAHRFFQHHKIRRQLLQNPWRSWPKNPTKPVKSQFHHFCQNIHYDVHCGCGVFLVEAAEDLCGWPGTPPNPPPCPHPPPPSPPRVLENESSASCELIGFSTTLEFASSSSVCSGVKWTWIPTTLWYITPIRNIPPPPL